MVDGSVGRRGRRGGAPCFNNGSASLLYRGNKTVFVPSLIDEIDGFFILDPGVEQVGVLRCRVIPPDCHASDVINGGARFLCNLCRGAVVIEARHGGKVARIQIRCIALCDQSISVSGIANHQDLGSARSVIIQCFALHGKNSGISFKQVFTLHAWSTGSSAHQQGVIGIFEAYVGIVSAHNTCQ